MVFILCNNVAKEPRNVESSKTKHNIKDLLLKYGGINVEAGKICVLCVGKLYSLREKTRAFYSFCQASYKLNIHQTRRMASSVSERLSKRKTIAETPTKGHCSKIPTPVKVNRTYSPKFMNNLHLMSTSQSKVQMATFGRASLRVKEAPKGKKCLFEDADSNVSTLLATNSIENIAGKRFLLMYTIRQTCPCNILQYCTAAKSKNGNFQIKKSYIFLIFAQNSKHRSWVHVRNISMRRF